MKVHELFTDENRWAKGVAGALRDVDGHLLHLDVSSPNATCWCLAGAIMRCYPMHDEYGPVMTRVREHLINVGRIKRGRLAMSDLTTFNDHVAHGFEEIKELAKTLDI